MSHVRRVVWNTRERILSTDFGNAAALFHRALIESVSAALIADGTLRSGVVRGMQTTVQNGTLNVIVSPGLSLLAETAATTYDSDLSWIEVRENVTVDLSGLVDPGNPRWVVIEAASNEDTEVSELRDIFDPASGTFSSQTVPKVQGSSPTITARGGTPAAEPSFPSGTTGAVPLAYVYVPASAATLTVGDVVLCRPLLKAPGTPDLQTGNLLTVQGGGVEAVGATDNVVLKDARGRFKGHAFDWEINSAVHTQLNVADQGSDSSFFPPAGITNVYFYACPPPYPSGYDASLAPREFILGSNAASRFSGAVSDGQANCIVVASTDAPNAYSLQGEPDSAGSFTITERAFGGAATIDKLDVVYLGHVLYDPPGVAGFRSQEVRGADVLPDPGFSPDIDLTDGGSPASIWEDSGTGSQIYPATALKVVCEMTVQVAAGNTGQVSATDDQNRTVQDHIEAGATALTRVWEFAPHVVPGSGNVTYSTSGTVAIGTLEARAYEDTILAKR